jgi:hypothetical protein
MTNEEISAQVVKIFEPHYKEGAAQAAQDFIRTHAQVFGLSPNDSLEPIADHLLLAAEKIVEPSLPRNQMTSYGPFGNGGLF